jgi:hypothetical protein
MRSTILSLCARGIGPGWSQLGEFGRFRQQQLAGISGRIVDSDNPALHRAYPCVYGELALLLSLISRPSTFCSSVLVVGRGWPPRRRSPELSPVTISWGRRLHTVQRVESRQARPSIRAILAGIAVIGSNCLTGDVLLCPSADGLGPRPRGNWRGTGSH